MNAPAGSIERTDGYFTFRYDRTFSQPVDTVWRAITEPTQIQQWTGSLPDIELRPGGAYITYHGKDMRVVDQVLEVDSPGLFSHTYFQQLNPDASVTWHLAESGTGCALTFTHVMSTGDISNAMDSVAAGDDEITILARNATGWHHLLDLLEGHIDAGTTPRITDELQDLQVHYAEVSRKLLA